MSGSDQDNNDINDDDGWAQYCRVACIDDTDGKARAGFSSVPRFIRARTVASAALLATREQLQPVDWLPRAARFFSCADRTTLFRDLLPTTESAAAPSIVSMDASSFVPLLALCPRKSDCILDLCCAPGMKLIAIADLLHHAANASSSSSAFVAGVDASLDRALVCRSLLSQHVSRQRIVQDALVGPGNSNEAGSAERFGSGHCRLYLADGTTFGFAADGRDPVAPPPPPPYQAPPELRCEASDPAKLARQERYQLKRVRAALLSGGEKQQQQKRRRERGDDEDDDGENRDAAKAAAAVPTVCLWETEGCPAARAGLLFDRVLVDAECTHDGSVAHADKFRLANFGSKNPSAPHENTGAAVVLATAESLAELTALQLRLLQRGFLNARRAGGVVVYSTCSMSPLQNEGVVRAFLAGFGPAADSVVQLVDPFEELQSVFLPPSSEEYRRDDGGGVSPALRFDDSVHLAKLRARCIVSAELPPCVLLHPRVASTSVQFVAKFVRLA